MDPLWALVAEWWWIGPAAAGASALGWAGVLVRRESTSRRASLASRPRTMSKSAARRLELDAAVLDLHSSRDAVIRRRAEVQVAKAELLRAQADRTDSRTSPATIEAARSRVQAAQREVRAAIAAVRARQAGVRAARATLPAIRAGRDPLPLERLMAHHDALTARWMMYETDPTLLLNYPSMTDARSPLLAAFLREQSHAQHLRPASSTTRTSPSEFLAYREAVRRATLAFDDAERDARRQAGENLPRGSAAPADMWSEVAQGLVDNAQRAVSDSVRAMGRAARDRFDRSRSAGAASDPGGAATRRTPPPASGTAQSAPTDPVPPASGVSPGSRPVWPVPRRDTSP